MGKYIEIVSSVFFNVDAPDGARLTVPNAGGGTYGALIVKVLVDLSNKMLSDDMT